MDRLVREHPERRPATVQVDLERDVRAVSDIRDLSVFRRFLGLLATRAGQVLNKTDLAGPLGVSVSTVDTWIGILEVTGLLFLAQPFTENFGKRLTKSPKIYFSDTGLLWEYHNGAWQTNYVSV